MATIIGLPKLSPTMEEGVLAKWHKKEGDSVSPGDIIAEVETDKANMDFPLEDEGTLLKLLVKEGDTVKLGAPVAILGEAGEDVSALEKQAGSAPAPAPAAKKAPEPEAEEPEPEPEAKPAPKAEAKPKPKAAAPAAAPAPAGRILASPLAKTLAAEHGVDLRMVKGTGPGGRIVERDVQKAMAAPQKQPEPEAAEAEAEAKPAPRPRPVPAPAEAGGEEEEFNDRSLSMMRKTIARRLLESKQTIPHFYLSGDIDAERLVAFRADINAVLGEEQKVSLNDVIVKATALALVRLPAANASFLGDRIRTHGNVHIGVAVSIDDGLVTPVVRHADRKGIAAIGAEIKEMAGRARIKKLLPEEMTGGTFTVSNLGMFGVDMFQAIINPPEAGILAVGTVRRLPVVRGDAVVAADRLSLSLSCDHRVIDGALGARLFGEIKKILEHPAVLSA